MAKAFISALKKNIILIVKNTIINIFGSNYGKDPGLIFRTP
jgi:hypothetical protein